MTESISGASVWLYSDDQIFCDRIAATAASLSVPFRRVSDEDLVGLSTHRGLLLVDLDKGIAPIQQAIGLARSSGQGRWHVCGYGAHLDSAGLLALRDAGADRVTSRSRLIQSLQHIIQEAIAG